MGVVKKAASHVETVLKGMIFIGFTIQIALGVLWMWRNFMGLQDFGASESVLYRRLFWLCGGKPCLLYLLQLALAFYAGYRFLRRLCLCLGFFGDSEGQQRERIFLVWGSLALLTFPFAMQCHLAVQPHSFMGSLFLLMLSFLVDLTAFTRKASVLGTPESSPCNFPFGFRAAGADRGRRTKRRMRAFLCAAACIGLLVILSGAADAERREGVPKHNIQSAMASRMAWPDIWNDLNRWTPDLQEMAREVLWETSYYPGNMDILLKAIEDRVGTEAAKSYYIQIAKTGWDYHSYMVIRQIGWDVLGYAVTPVIFRLQLEGQAYDSYTGRNYEIMRGNSPVLTKYYVDYGCWWFGCLFAFTLLLILKRILTAEAAGWKRWIAPVGICIAASAVLVFLLTMRGAGMMDYKYTAAVNELWYMAGILLINPAHK